MPIDIENLVDENGQAVSASAVFDVSPPTGGEIASASTDDVSTPQFTDTAAAQQPAGDSLPPGTDGAPGAATPTAPGADGQAASQQPAPWYHEVGLPPEYVKDEATAVNALKRVMNEARELYSQSEDDRKWADIGRTLSRVQSATSAASQQAAPQPTAAPQQPSLPEVNPLWERYRDPATGQYLVEKMPEQMRDGFMQYAHSVRTFQEKLYRQPETVIAPLIESALKPLQERLDQMARAQEEAPRQADAQRFLQENETWMLQRNPLNQRVELTPAGHKFREYYASAMQQGAPEQIAREFAMTSLTNLALQARMQQANGASQPQVGAAGVSAPAAQPADPRAALLATNPGAANKTPARNGSIARETPAQPQFRVGHDDDKVTEHLNAVLRKMGVTDNASQLSFAPPN